MKARPGCDKSLAWRSSIPLPTFVATRSLLSGRCRSASLVRCEGIGAIGFVEPVPSGRVYGGRTMATPRAGERDVPDREEALQRAAEGDDPVAWIDFGGWLLLNGRPAHEYRPWLRKAQGSQLNGHHFSIEYLLEDLIDAGRPDDAFEALVLSGAATEGEAALRVAQRWDRHRPQEAEAWYRQAAETGEPDGLVAYGWWLERAGRGEEAGPLYQQADVLGDLAGGLCVARWYAARGLCEQALEAAGRAVHRAEVTQRGRRRRTARICSAAPCSRRGTWRSCAVTRRV